MSDEKTPLIDAEVAYHLLQQKLEDISLSIKESQPVGDGAILLYLSNCGKGCDFCPHPRWRKWVGGTMAKQRWFAVDIGSPKRMARAAAYSEETRRLINEAADIMKDRDAMVQGMSLVKSRARKIIKKLRS